MEKPDAYEVSYRVPAGTHLVALYHYTRERISNPGAKGYYAHLIMKEGWYDDSGMSLFGTSITGGYHESAQAAIDDAYEKMLAHVAQVNAEIPLRNAKRLEAVNAPIRNYEPRPIKPIDRAAIAGLNLEIDL